MEAQLVPPSTGSKQRPSVEHAILAPYRLVRTAANDGYAASLAGSAEAIKSTLRIGEANLCSKSITRFELLHVSMRSPHVSDYGLLSEALPRKLSRRSV